jgi:hypothetical protein
MIKYLYIFHLTHVRGGKAEILQKISFAVWAIEFQEKILLKLPDF